MHTSVRASAPRLAHRRALVPIGTRGLVLSRIDYLIPNRLSYPECAESCARGTGRSSVDAEMCTVVFEMRLGKLDPEIP